MHISRDGQKLILPWRQDLASVIPHAREVTLDGGRMLVMPNGRDEAKLCRNLGVPVPAPILSRYDWSGFKPWEIQKTTAALLTESPRAYVLSTMGTGKTLSAMWAADYLRLEGRCRRVLVVAPLSTLTPVWEAEYFKVMPRRRVVVLHGSREKRSRLLAADADIYVINHHGVAIMADELIARGFDVVIIDEMATFRNKRSDLWKGMDRVLRGCKPGWAWGLTGSPTPHAPSDAWGQLMLLTPERTVRTMAQFQDLTMRRVSTFRWIAREDANDVVHRMMQPSVRYTRDDVAELPPTTYKDVPIKLEPQAAKAYKMLFDKARTTTDCGKSITAANEGVLHNKLLQVACGYIYTDTRTVYELPHQSRLDAMLELIEQSASKVIVFVPYVHALEGIAGFLRDNKVDVATVSGATTRARRDKIFTAFQTTSDIRVIVAHPQCMAHGLTLTSADTIIWYAPSSSLEIYEQANARIVRPSQTRKTLIAHLVGTNVERATYTRLKGRAKQQGVLLELFHQQELDF